MSSFQGRVAVVGLGELGGPLAVHLGRSGATVSVADQDAVRVDSVVQTCPERVLDGRGGAVWSTPVALCLLPDSEVTAAVLEEAVDGGWLRSPTTVVDLSSGHPHRAPAIARVLARAGVSYVAAPVLRGSGADAGRGGLVLAVGGDASQVDAVRPVLASIGSIAALLPSAAQAQALKLVNNYVALGVSALLAEAVAVAATVGVPRTACLQLLTAGSASSWVSLPHATAVMEKADQPPAPAGFRAALAEKDLRYVVDVAAAAGIPAPVAGGVHTVYGQAAFTGNSSAEAGVWPWRWLSGAPRGPVSRP